MAKKVSVTARLNGEHPGESMWRGGVQWLRHWQTFELSQEDADKVAADRFLELKVEPSEVAEVETATVPDGEPTGEAAEQKPGGIIEALKNLGK